MISEIMSTAKAFAGTALGDEETTVLQRLCEESFIQWGGRLQGGLTPEDCAGAMIPACACSALASLVTLRAANAGPSFRAGDVSVQEDAGLRQGVSQKLRRQAEELMAPYAEPDNFAFRRVKG